MTADPKKKSIPAPAGASAPAARIPLIPLRDLVVCPDMVVPVVVGRPASTGALEQALLGDKRLCLVAQTKPDVEEPGPGELFTVGCVARVLQTMRSPDGSVRALVEGIERARVLRAERVEGIWMAHVAPITFLPLANTAEAAALRRATETLFDEYVRMNPKLPDELLQTISGIDDPVRLYHVFVGHLTVKTEEKVSLLEQADLEKAYRELCRILSREIELLGLEQRIYGEVRKQLDEQQKSYFLHEQMRVIERELGKKGYNESAELQKRVKEAHMPGPAVKVALAEVEKLEKMAPFSPEATVVRNYLDWLLAMPWSKATNDNLDLAHARATLEKTHYGLKEPKERVLEFLAVRRLRGEREAEARMRRKGRAGAPPGETSTILCLVGPPGVGKTSLARAIADSLGRTFVRISLGGVRDEAEIRGHRRTYIGAMPGRVIQALKKAGTCNPVILLDEIDKVSSDYRGDPSAALLEVLDPEQNQAFNDHYLEVDVDLSRVMFITTANVADAIHPTLRDRMETIELSSYTEREKVEIARRFLVEKQRLAAGIARRIELGDDVLVRLIRRYTHEAGVRQLDRSIARIMRKIALKSVSGAEKPARRLRVTPDALREYLGAERHRPDDELPVPGCGVAVGLAWTEVGGDMLKIEVTVLDGKGELTLTGQLGDVMQESARAAMTYVRSRLRQLGLPRTFFAKHDVHIHVPEGAIPKDGPSAGITLAAALYSALGNKPVRERLAMTGEITLRGSVLQVGGLKEKLLAAHRAGVRTVLIPARNAADLDDIPPDVRSALDIRLVTTMDEVAAEAFGGKGPRRGAR